MSEPLKDAKRIFVRLGGLGDDNTAEADTRGGRLGLLLAFRSNPLLRQWRLAHPGAAPCHDCESSHRKIS